MRKLFILLTLFLTSCGYSIAVQKSNTTTTTTTTTVLPTTTTTIDFGSDCHSQNDTKLDELAQAIEEAAENRDSVPTYKQWTAEANAWRKYRLFIRSLDIPTLIVEQNAYVDAIQDYLVAYNRYMESRKTDLSVNNYRDIVLDTGQDFIEAWNSVCMNRLKGI